MMVNAEDEEFFDDSHAEHTQYIRNGSVHIGRVTRIGERHVEISGGADGAGAKSIPFDFLVIASGTSYRSEIKTDKTSLACVGWWWWRGGA